MPRGPFEWEEDFQRLGERVGDFFDRVFDLASAPRFGLQQTWRPDVDVYRVTGGINVIVELPGVEEAQLKVVVERDRLRISGTRRPPAVEAPAEPLQLEINYGPFERVLALPNEAVADGITAHFQHGLLTVYVPIHEPRGPVHVRVGEPGDDSREP
jgi:HSP20 family protein